MAPTRVLFREELAQLERDAMGGLDLVAELLEPTLVALEGCDAAVAAQVIAGDDRVDARFLAVHEGVISLMARQTPVATDLRLVAALLHVAGHFERMGDQCVNVAKLVAAEEGSGRPWGADQMLGRLVEMGGLARDQVLEAKHAFVARDLARAQALVTTDDAIDKLNRECFDVALRLAADERSREWAMHMLLAARALERVGDNAVDVGEQMAFVVTGTYAEFEDASHSHVA
jgi:phosphate transport system protein